MNEYVRFADAKALAVVAWTSGLIGAMYAAGAHVAFLPSAWVDGIGVRNVLGAIGAALGFVLLLAGASCSLIALRPNLKATDSKGLIFWGTILNYKDAAAYGEAVARADAARLNVETSRHIFDISRVLNAKFRWVNLGMILAAAGSAISLLFLMVRVD